MTGLPELAPSVNQPTAEELLYGTWRDRGLSASPRFDGNGITFCCEACERGILVIAGSRPNLTASCTDCQWQASGSARAIATAGYEAQLARLGVEPATEAPLFANIGELIAGGLAPELPVVARISTAQCLFYKGRLNEIHGEPAVGKTNIMLASSIAVMREGGHVVYIDPEDNAYGIIRRLLALGADKAALIERFHYCQDPDAEAYCRLHAWVASKTGVFVVLDGIAEALSKEGIDEDKSKDFLPWCRARLRPFVDAGAGVAVSDHVAKNPENRGRFARGTGAKLGRYDGAVYQAELVEGYSPTKAGSVRLRVSKDRNGGVGIAGQVITELHFTPDSGKTRIEWRQPATPSEFMPTAIMEKVSRCLVINPNASLRDLRALGKSQFVDQAIAKLEEIGCLDVIKAVPGRATKFNLLKEFHP
jgi:AAA domain